MMCAIFTTFRDKKNEINPFAKDTHYCVIF